MAAAIFFVSGGPLVWGPSLFLCPQGGVVLVWVCCVRVWGCFGVYTKSQGYKAPGIFTLI